MAFQISDPERYQRAVARFDALNTQDPNLYDHEGRDVPWELFASRQMLRWVEKLYREVPEPVALAAHCQHLCRWEIPRHTYPEGRAGYLKWRSDLKQFHADKGAEVLEEVGYDADMIEAVRAINLKKQLKKSIQTQMIEDALCMVFLEFQYEDYSEKWEEEKLIGILQKTWVKMSELAQDAAQTLPLGEKAQKILAKALDK